MSKANANKPEAKSKSKSIDVVEPEEKPEVMKKSTAAHLKVLSAMCADPTKAARAMLDAGKKHFKQTSKQISFITLE